MIPWWAAILVSMALIVWSLFCIGIGGTITNAAHKRKALEQIAKNASAETASKKGEGIVFPWPDRES